MRTSFFLLSGSFFSRSFSAPFVQDAVDLLGAIRIAQLVLINLPLQVLDWWFERVGFAFIHFFSSRALQVEIQWELILSRI
jgi:hypothetical protein